MEIKEELKELGDRTWRLKGKLWLRNIEDNKKLYGFKPTIGELENKHKNQKAIIFSAGCHKDWLDRDHLGKIYSMKDRPLVIACDHAIPLFVDKGYTPDYIVSVDGSPLIAKYFWRKLKEKPKGVLLHTSIHPTTVEMVKAYEYPIYWFQHHKRKELAELFVEGVDSIGAAGNVGTHAWLIALAVLKCKKVGLLDIEFAWSDEVPYRDRDRVPRLLYEYFYNPHTKTKYIADTIYSLYMKNFKQGYESKANKQERTVCLTKEGIIYESGIKYQSLEDYINSKLVV